MAKDKLTEYDATAANNTVVGDVNLAENSALPSDMNNAVRELMSHLKNFSDGTDAIDALTVTGDLTVDTNTLKVDAANNRVGIGDAAPSRRLVVKDTSGNCDVLIEGGNSNASQLLFGDQDAEVRGYVSYNHSSDRLRLGAGGSDRVSLDGDGLKFGSDTAAANALDDAEYGSWTATLTGSASAPSTAVTTTGNYRKIGRLVFVECRFANVNTTGASGTCYVTGFPYSSVATFAGGDVMSQYTLNVNSTSANIAPFFANSTTLQFQQTRQSIATWVAASITAGAGRYLYLSMTYPTSS